MKLSKFNINNDINQKQKILYNSLSSGVLLLENDVTVNLEELVHQNNIDIDCNEDLIQELKRGQMIVNDDFNEIDYLILRDRANRFSTNSLGLTIAPTLKCNFSCPYCYEEGYRNNTMDKDTQEAVVKFVEDKSKGVSNVNITWYGGEPLLNMDTIEYLSNRFFEDFSDKVYYSAGIITNGYFLNEEFANRLKEVKVNYAQVTIDGCPDTHNKRRILCNGEGTFDRIVSNIKKVCEIIPIHVRINVDKSNIDELYHLFEHPDIISLKNKVGFYIAPVDDFSNSCSDPACFTASEFSEKEIDFLKKTFERGFNLLSLSPMGPTICGALSLNSFVIDPKGDIYKCWEHIGREEEKIGNISSGKWNISHLSKWLLYDCFESSECRECSVLPVCLGGCPYFKLKTNTNKCKSIKFNAEKTLELLNRVKSPS